MGTVLSKFQKTPWYFRVLLTPKYRRKEIIIINNKPYIKWVHYTEQEYFHCLIWEM